MQLRSALFTMAMVWAPLAAQGQQQTEPLRFSASPSWSMPYVEVREDRQVGSIVFDLTQATGAALHLPMRYVVLPLQDHSLLREDAVDQEKG